jgi:hypothetical protein
MSFTDMGAVIGRYGQISTNELIFNVRITDVKNAYGNVRYLVTPASGIGQTWVNAERVRVLEGGL